MKLLKNLRKAMGAMVGKKKPAGVLQSSGPRPVVSGAATPEDATPTPAEAKPAVMKLKKKPGFVRGAVKGVVKRAFLR